MYINRAHMFLDEGIIIEDEVKFPKLRGYEEGHELCKLSGICDQNNLKGYPSNLLDERFKETHTKHIELEYLSKEFKWIEPNEDIEETKVIILLKNGFYRLTCVIRSSDIPSKCACRDEIILCDSSQEVTR